jgi:alkylhydroperoxidase family enzyme
MKLPIHTEATAPERSRTVMASISEDLGFVPNLAATTAGSPALISAFDSLRRAAGSTDLDPVDREIAGLATGLASDNHYGIAFHSTVLANLGVETEEIETMRKGAAPSDSRRAAVYEFATVLARGRGVVDDDVVRRLEDNGFDEGGVLDLITEYVFASLVGVVDNLAGHVELDEFRQPLAWKG